MCSIAEKMRPEGEKGGMPIINMKNATADIRPLAKALELSQLQIVILTAIVQKSARYCVAGNELAEELDMLMELNPDNAFERRFLYKIRFNKPSAEVTGPPFTPCTNGLSSALVILTFAEFFQALNLCEPSSLKGQESRHMRRKRFLSPMSRSR